MNSSSAQDEGGSTSQWIAHGGRGALRLSWTVVRLPMLALLVVMEPFVCGALSVLAALGVFVTLLLEFVVKLPHFPFWTMLGISAGLAVLQIPYYFLIRLFSGR